jgi:diacylglycerol kinase (ATP)
MTSAGRPSQLRRRVRSFQYAFEGWWHVLRTQPNAWIHGAISVAVLLLGVWLRLGAGDWALLVLTLTVVWTAEFLNTAVEALADFYSPEKHPLAKTAKDVAAAAVLVGALGAIAVGLLVLGPPLLARLSP